MGNLIKTIIVIVITYLIISFGAWNFKWYLEFGLMKVETRIASGLLLILLTSLVFCLLSLIELEL